DCVEWAVEIPGRHAGYGLLEESAGGIEGVRLVPPRAQTPSARLRILEGVLDDPLAPLAGDDADRFRGAALLVDVVLDARVEPLRVLADDHQVDARVARLDAGEGPRRAHVRVQVEFLP